MRLSMYRADAPPQPRVRPTYAQWRYRHRPSMTPRRTQRTRRNFFPLAPHGSRLVSNPFSFLDPLNDLEAKIQELEDLGESTGMDMQSEIDSLLEKLDQATRNVFEELTPWQRVTAVTSPRTSPDQRLHRLHAG